MGYHFIVTDLPPLVHAMTELDANRYLGGGGEPSCGEDLDNSTLLAVIDCLVAEEALVLELPATAVRQVAARLNACADQIEAREAAQRKSAGP